MDSSQFQQLSPRQHVLQCPGVYVGSTVLDTSSQYVWDFEKNNIVQKDVTVAPAFVKIFQEAISNACDHVIRLQKMAAEGKEVKLAKDIKVSVDRESGSITVLNSGTSIPIEVHPEKGIYIPELIFGNLLTSSNYTDENRAGLIGMNGLGVKCVSIFSKRFSVQIVDDRSSKMYTQTWTENMSVVTPPKIKTSKVYPYCSVTFEPDYERFGAQGLTDDVYALLARNVFDLAAVIESSVNVHFNDIKIPARGLEKYAHLYIGQDKSQVERFADTLAEGWDVVVARSTSGFKHVSFVNGAPTPRGGKHVDAAADLIVRSLVAMILEKKKKSVKPAHIRQNLHLFLKSTVSTAQFDSQCKECLVTAIKDFGIKLAMPDKLLDKLYKSSIVSAAMELGAGDEEKALAKTDGKKRSKVAVAKLDDATFAGTARSQECTLLLTEGDSAKSSVIAGLKEVGREFYGVFALRGKVLNISGAGEKLSTNQEINDIKKIVGLQASKVYGPEDLKALRYGRIMALTDGDVDGSHIKGLIINVFASLWPSLLKSEGFLTSLQTPVIKAFRGNETIDFYSPKHFEEWAKTNPDASKYALKYYKGLGTSTAQEARSWFRNPRQCLYKFRDERDTEAINLAFDKKRADDRKAWLLSMDRSQTLDDAQEVPFEDFINKELLHFSIYDTERSIPSAIDGLKPSQRKILFGCFKRKLTSEVKVAQLSGYVSEHSAYHHGEVSLQGAIVNMAQDFVGSNNLNLLQPRGQFGSRIMGGKDSASARYIYTMLDPVVATLFHPDDLAVLDYLTDDGQQIEPKYYVPVLPLVLVNGGLGIGTGFSCTVPSYNPRDIVTALKKKLAATAVDSEAVEVADVEEQQQPTPWFRGFKGEIESTTKGSFVTKGLFTKLSSDEIKITELPVGTWSDNYKDDLETLLANGTIKDYDGSLYTDTDAVFKVKMASSDDSKIGSVLKLVSRPITTSNMHLFDSKGRIRKFATFTDIIDEFFEVRMATYVKRKDHMLAVLAREAELAGEKARFVADVISGAIAVMNVPRANLLARLDELDYKRIDGSFDHLTRLPIHSLTAERRAELEESVRVANEKVAVLKATTVTKMWLDDLEAFERAWEEHMSAWNAKYAMAGQGSGASTSKAVKRRANAATQPAKRVSKTAGKAKAVTTSAVTEK